MKRVIKLIFIICFLILLGCNASRLIQTVQDKYPNSLVVQVPGYKFQYIIKTPEGIIKYICLDMNYEIYSEVILFK